MASNSQPQHLSLLSRSFAILRLAPDAVIPAWCHGGAFVSVTRTEDELSIVCDATTVPAGFEVPMETGFRCLKVRGPLAFSETGILASLSATLRDAGVSIFAVSTYDTDYILVPQAIVVKAIGALREAGNIVDE